MRHHVAPLTLIFTTALSTTPIIIPLIARPGPSPKKHVLGAIRRQRNVHISRQPVNAIRQLLKTNVHLPSVLPPELCEKTPLARGEFVATQVFFHAVHEYMRHQPS